MKLKKSKYYDEKFLGKNLYEIIDYEEIFTIQEYFNINDNQKEYLKEGRNINNRYYRYKLTIEEDHYELDCRKRDVNLFLIFDKPVHIIGKYCSRIIAPEIVIKSNENDFLSCCVTNKVIINNNCKSYYQISETKANNVYFYNEKVNFYNAEASNFFIFNKGLYFYDGSDFLDYHKVKIFGKNSDLKDKILNDEHFKKRIIHIE